MRARSFNSRFMCQDKSEGYRDTWEFLDARLKDVGSIGQGMGMVKGAVQGAIGVVGGYTRHYRR
jgi:ubiquinone biosynthesis protein COQ9